MRKDDFIVEAVRVSVILEYDCGNPKPKPAQRLENAGEMQDVPFSRGIMKETAIGNMLQEGGNGIKERDMTMGHQLVRLDDCGGRK
ncbi:hypothetical protein PRIPAC_72592 [Pristionchus pacificus]|uniref:Uncharacterized protein n=1 Tax=Pristionchus pacificus TaxID=54126 RepID=A0A2A6BFN6_PRIPA|nr:hypothetical protein PRIPAC_72592 [Pristionchus pacificus]|eukprot:PDM64676.1 hypothetical protein PRIPAC_52932 [Pristionchus pacificus]